MSGAEWFIYAMGGVAGFVVGFAIAVAHEILSERDR